MSDFTDQLHAASFRGVPFGVELSSAHFGRRVAVHEYPFRDKPWAEDLGRRTRPITIVGFLVQDSLVYGGGSVFAQQKALIAAAETKGPGTLIHPSYGALTVSLLDLSVNESKEDGRVFRFEMTVIESGAATFPTNTASTADLVAQAAANAQSGAAASFATTVGLIPFAGGATLSALGVSVENWAGQITGLGGDASSLFNLAADLGGNFGRYVNGGLVGFTGAAPLSLLTTVEQLIPIASARRASLTAALAHEASVAANLGLPGNLATDLAAAVQASTAALAATAANPGDALRLLQTLCVYSDGDDSPIGQALGALHRRAALISLSQAAQTYQPASYDDANAVRDLVAAALDVEIDAAGDAGDDAAFTSLRALRVAVVQDLTARGADLARTIVVTSPTFLPSLVIANRLYGDAGRADELVTEANPRSPLFMPLAFKALAA